jgi:hypothetical protein
MEDMIVDQLRHTFSSSVRAVVTTVLLEAARECEDVASEGEGFRESNSSDWYDAATVCKERILAIVNREWKDIWPETTKA